MIAVSRTNTAPKPRSPQKRRAKTYNTKSVPTTENQKKTPSVTVRGAFFVRNFSYVSEIQPVSLVIWGQSRGSPNKKSSPIAVAISATRNSKSLLPPRLRRRVALRVLIKALMPVIDLEGCGPSQPVTEAREKLGGEALAPPGASPMPNKGLSSPR